MAIEFLTDVFAKNDDKDAIVYRDKTYSYHWLLDKINYWKKNLKSNNVRKGSVVALEADFSPNSVALLLALIEFGYIIVPLTSSVESKKSGFIKIAQCELSFLINADDNVSINKIANQSKHEIYRNLRKKQHAGLVLFSSGSTGEPKAAVHDFEALLTKFKTPRHSYRAISFLLFDHIGGLNTLFYNISNAGCILTVQDRNPDFVLSAIEKYKVELLPTSPTFINLILLSEAYKRYDLSSLKIVTYGTEPMPESTLKRFHELFPRIKLLQTYGLSELGILRSKSKNSDSLWVKIGGDGFETRVVDGVLQIKAQSAILGYLNAPSPFTDDGWFITGDSVEEDGEYIKILGRETEIINVGGEKVYPAEIESLIQQLDNVHEVTVYGEKNPIIGNIVCARVRLMVPENSNSFKKRLKKFCHARLEKYKVPVKVVIAKEKQYSKRFKKIRNLY